MTQLSDEILIAYADGELGAEQVRVVDGVLAADALTLDKFQQQVATNKRLSRAFSSMLEAEAKQLASERLKSAPAQQPIQHDIPKREKVSRNIMVPVVAVGVMFLALGAIGGYLAGNTQDPDGLGGDPFSPANFWNNDQMKADQARSNAFFKNVDEPKTTAATTNRRTGSSKKWFEFVAARHKKDTPALFDKYDGKSRNRDLALFQFSKTDIAPSMIPLLKEEELTFVGASPVKIKGHSYARLAYRDLSNGAVPVGLYVGKAKGGSLTLERGYRENDNYVRWTQGDRSYMLIGAVPHWRLIVLSVSVQRQLVQ
jgi:hypothetical protein